MIADRVIFVCTIVVAAVYFYATAQIPSLDIGDPLGPKAFPRLLGFCLLATAALLLFEIVKAAAARRGADRASAQTAPSDGRGHYGLIAAVVGWTGLYFYVFDGLGYILATAVYLFVLMMWFHRGQWLANGLTSVLFSLGSYVLFVKLLTVSLAKGIFSF